MPYATTTAASALNDRNSLSASGVLRVFGLSTAIPKRRASCSIGVGCSFMPRPAGLASRVYTAAISWPCAASARKVGTAKSGVPMKIKRSAIGEADLLRSGLFGGALGSLGEFLQNAVALQLRKVVHEQHAIEMIDLVLDAG